MCHHCEPKCSSKQAKQCFKTKVICHLPYSISKSGHYCLGKDFTWSDSTQSAITITADNVVLDFNHRLIETTVASEFPLVLVDGATDVVLDNVHLKATGEAQDQSVGLKILSSCAVKVSDPVLLDLTIGSLIEDSRNVKTTNVTIKNQIPQFEAFFIKSSFDVTLSKGSIVNGTIVAPFGVEGGQSIVVEDLNVDNSASTEGFASTCLRLYGYDNVRISRNTFIGGNNKNIVTISTGNFARPLVYSKNYIIENNLMKGGFETRGFAALIDCLLLQGIQCYTVRNNQIKSNGIVAFFSNNCSHGNIENNTVAGLLDPGFTFGIGLSGFDGPGGDVGSYNTVNNNVVSGFSVGLADNDPFGDWSICSVFKNNVVTGNDLNFDFNQPTTINDASNIYGCELVAAVSLSTLKEEAKEKLIKRRRQDA